MNTQIQTLFKAVALRFVKGGLAGAGAVLATITISVPHTWTDLSMALTALIYAVVVGFVAGGILAIEKAYNWTDTPTTASSTTVAQV